MSKRFTDTAIWDKAWFRKLSPRLKEAWRYLCEKCDHAGIWDIDMEAMSFNVGEIVTLIELLEFFDISQYDNKVVINSFIEFQYNCSKDKLNPQNNVHKSVIERLNRLTPNKVLMSPLLGDKDKDKD